MIYIYLLYYLLNLNGLLKAIVVTKCLELILVYIKKHIPLGSDSKGRRGHRCYHFRSRV